MEVRERMGQFESVEDSYKCCTPSSLSILSPKSGAAKH